MQQWNAKVLFPADSDYSNRVLKATFGPAKSSGNPMITLEMEVVTPASKDIGGEEYNLAGCKTTNYYSLKAFDEDGTEDTEGTKKCQKRITDLYTAFGLTPPTDFNSPLDVSGFKNKIVLTQMNSKPDYQRKTPTAEQIAKGERGSVQKHPITGKDLINYWPQVQEIYGLAPEGMSAVGGGTATY